MGIRETPWPTRCAAELLGAFVPFFSVGFNVLSGGALFGGLSLSATLPLGVGVRWEGLGVGRDAD